MNVGSYPELFDTLIGWQQYQSIWNLLTQTGLVYLPFAMFFLKEWIDSATHHHSGIYLIRKTFIHFFIALCIIEMCMQPSMALNPTMLQFTPVCNVSGQPPATPGNSGTTYDQTTPVPGNVEIPVFWYLVMDLSHGLALGMSSGFTCMPDLQEIKTTVNTAQITDPVVKKQIMQFYTDCYRPAFTKYLATQTASHPNTPGAMDMNLDVQWIGSNTFLTSPGYYDSISASTPVAGFPYDPNRDFEYGQYHGEWGRPTCQQWWNDPTSGIQQAIQATIKPTMWQSIKGLATGNSGVVAAEKQIISSSVGSDFQNLGDEAMANNSMLFTGVLPAVGTIAASLSTLPKYYELISALPIIQANILMGLYLLLALMIPLSGYKLSAIVAFTMGIFSVTMWTFFFQFAAYVNFTETSALFPVDQFFSSTQSLLLEYTNLTTYIGFPFLWSMAMSWIGHKGGSMADTMLTAGSASVASAGAGGASAVGSASSTIAKVAPLLML